MPSIIPGYLYSLFATIIVGALIIAMCGLSVSNIKAQTESQQLSNVADYVAAKSMELIAKAPQNNVSLKFALDVPQVIGNQRYWIQILNDSSSARVEVGFGLVAFSSDYRAVIPSEAAGYGLYVSGSGPAFLQYQSNSTGSYLAIYGGN
jgi:hypothetical protein